MLEVVNISVAYNNRRALRDISFSLAPGRIIALLGPNGAGKTTLLKALNGSQTLTDGEIRLDGQLVCSISRREIAQKIAVVAQETETKFPVTVREFVLAGRFAHGGVFGWEDERDAAAAADALMRCDLGGYEARLMNQLSGGERQRVVLARALAAETNILLLDEPTANLDLAHQGLMLRLVRERCRVCGASAIVITHDLNLAADFAHEMIMLREGKIVAKGKTEDVLTAENLSAVFQVETLVDANPVTGRLRVTTVY
jgi:iron complex transport system ATP-binding protein